MANKGWREYPENKPNKIGYYLCTVNNVNNKQHIMMLLYESEGNFWLDINRLKVFKEFEIYKPCIGPDGKENSSLERITYQDDELCIRTDVIAFKNLPKIYNK